MPGEQSLEGWVPVLGDGVTLADVIDKAFDYRGDTTVVKRDGTEMVCYISNRDRRAPEPVLHYFDEQGDGPFRLLYSEIENIRFTGRDTAAGKSWQAWVALATAAWPTSMATMKSERLMWLSFLVSGVRVRSEKPDGSVPAGARLRGPGGVFHVRRERYVRAAASKNRVSYHNYFTPTPERRDEARPVHDRPRL